MPTLTTAWAAKRPRCSICEIPVCALRLRIGDTSPADTLQIDYDALGRVVKQDRLIGTTHYVVTKTYDAGGLVSIAYPDGDTVGPMQYDGAGRVSSISGILTSVVYDALGRPTSQSNGNGTQTSWSYLDPRGFLSRIQTTGSAGTIQDLLYTQYKDSGLLEQVTSPIGGEGWSYAYDDLNHLTTATNLTNGADSQSYTYDAGDRILTSSRYGSYTYPAITSPRPHGPTAVGGTALSYDANGNTLTAGTRGLTWNADNRLSQTAMGDLLTTFSYGGDGERVKKASLMGTSLYPFGDDYEITGGVTTKYVTVDGLGVVAKRVGTGPGAVTHWLHTDRLGSIQAVTNTSGAIVFRRQYRPYGEKLAQSGTHTESRGWIDQRNDGESRLTYLHARYFDPQLGVFVSPDPIGVEGGMNTYGYADGDPLNASDPSGLSPWTCVPGTVCLTVPYDPGSGGDHAVPRSSVPGAPPGGTPGGGFNVGFCIGGCGSPFYGGGSGDLSSIWHAITSFFGGLFGGGGPSGPHNIPPWHTRPPQGGVPAAAPAVEEPPAIVIGPPVIVAPPPAPGDGGGGGRAHPAPVSRPKGFDAIGFATCVDERRFDWAALVSSGSTLAFGTLPKSAKEVSGAIGKAASDAAGSARGGSNPWTNQVRRWGSRSGDLELKLTAKAVGRSSLRVAFGAAATTTMVFEGYYDIGVMMNCAYEAH